MTTTDPAVKAAIAAVKRFHFDNYGLDDVDPKSKDAEWVQPLAEKITAAVRKADGPESLREAASTLLTVANEMDVR